MKTFDLFNQSSKFSTKYKKYFDVYDKTFERFKNKKITFVEVGVLNGGSLEIWKKYFHPDSRIIGIDLNPECKKFEKNGIEIFIGDQADEKFWEDFYNRVGKIDILLDDGGHTNLQQIVTTIKSIKNINDDGLLIVEDTHSSYMPKFGNPSKYSFMNFTKKLIDDLNYKFPNLGNFEKSYNDYIYSITFFESFVIFHVNKQKTFLNSSTKNKIVENQNVKDYRSYNSILEKVLRNKFFDRFKFLKKNKFIYFLYRIFSNKIKFLESKSEVNKSKKYFK